jgi:hypothetical protein
MTVRELQGHLLELYGLEVSPDLVSTVTDVACRQDDVQTVLRFRRTRPWSLVAASKGRGAKAINWLRDLCAVRPRD